MSRTKSGFRRTRPAVAGAILLLIAPVLSAQYARWPAAFPSEAVIVRQDADGVLERSTDGGRRWQAVPGLPTRVLPAYREGEPLPVTAFASTARPTEASRSLPALAASPGANRPGYHVVPTSGVFLAGVGNRLLASRDGLATWTEVVLDGATNPASYITALAVDPADERHWLLGTSYDGLYRTTDAGASWTELTATRENWPSYLGARFFEEFAGLWFTGNGDVIAALGFGQGFLRIRLDPLSVTRLQPLAGGDDAYAAIGSAILAGNAGGSGRLLVDTRRRPEGSRYVEGAAGAQGVGESGGGDADSDAAPDPARVRSSEAAAARRAIAADRTGIYLAARNATPERLPGYFDTMERHGFNSVVVDFKDDEGRLTYASELALPRAAGAIMPIIDPRELVREAHARGIYVIARVVVFKDPVLAAYDGHRYSLWDSRRNRPWGVYRTYTDEETGENRTVQVESWADAYSSEVWAYNIDIAREIVGYGVDEIQFDYIRFPSDGDTADITARYALEGADRVQALEGFLAAARAAIEAPIGIDVFGFNAWSRMNYLGQDITRLADYVDVISPMFYPSHFARPFLPQFSYLDRSYVIYDLGTRRAHALANHGLERRESGATGTLIRPYIQAFLIGPELAYEEPVYTRYLELQVAASRAAPASGYTLWNASGRYYMLP